MVTVEKEAQSVQPHPSQRMYAGITFATSSAWIPHTISDVREKLSWRGLSTLFPSSLPSLWMAPLLYGSLGSLFTRMQKTAVTPTRAYYKYFCHLVCPVCFHALEETHVRVESPLARDVALVVAAQVPLANHVRLIPGILHVLREYLFRARARERERNRCI